MKKMRCACVVYISITSDDLPYARPIEPYGLKGFIANCDCRLCQGSGYDPRSEQDLLNQMFNAFNLLRLAGWCDDIRAAPIGRTFEIIEIGSTGIHRGYRDDHGFWIVDNIDTWSCQAVILWREIPN